MGGSYFHFSSRQGALCLINEMSVLAQKLVDLIVVGNYLLRVFFCLRLPTTGINLPSYHFENFVLILTLPGFFSKFINFYIYKFYGAEVNGSKIIQLTSVRNPAFILEWQKMGMRIHWYLALRNAELKWIPPICIVPLNGRTCLDSYEFSITSGNAVDIAPITKQKVDAY